MVNVFVVELFEARHDIAVEVANLAGEWIQHVCKLLSRFHLQLDLRGCEGRQELENLVKDDQELLTEVLDEESLEFEKFLDYRHHLLQVLLDCLIPLSLVKQMQSVDDADGAADLLNFQVVALDEVVKLALYDLLRNQLRLVGSLRRWKLTTFDSCAGTSCSGCSTLHLSVLEQVLVLLRQGQVFSILTVLGQLLKLVLFSDLFLEVLKVCQNRLAEPLREVVVEHFDYAAQVLELLDLGLVGRDRKENGSDAVS